MGCSYFIEKDEYEDLLSKNIIEIFNKYGIVIDDIIRREEKYTSSDYSYYKIRLSYKNFDLEITCYDSKNEPFKTGLNMLIESLEKGIENKQYCAKNKENDIMLLEKVKAIKKDVEQL